MDTNAHNIMRDEVNGRYSIHQQNLNLKLSMGVTEVLITNKLKILMHLI